ncbi:MAG TPA: FtsX-like permease family protein [Steroidobacteraceae bacterium]|nr:FtsX-like permease family protein [Steroidobacteraceae bacterium]
MSLNLRSLTSALLRRRAGAVLVALQVAIALAIMVNAVYIVQQRVTWIVRPTGIDVTHLFVISSSSLASRPDAGHAIEEDLAYLRSLPNVISATASNSVPFNLGGNIGIWLRPGHQGRELNPRYLIMDSAGLGTLGAHLLAGRNFKPEEIRPPDTADDLGDFVSELIVSRAFARALFPSGAAVGKVVYFENDRPVTIIGIIDDLRVARASASAGDLLAIFPSLPSATSTVDYLVRTRAGERDAVMRDAALHLADSNPDRVINWARPLTFFKWNADAEDRNTAICLTVITALLLAITCLGIFGLVTFNVSSRTKQIGTLRAVGARRRDVVAHFMVENAIVLTTGVLTGCALALAVGYWLSLRYGLPRLDLYYLVSGVVALWVVGQLAAWHPARRAASVPPSVATRTV